MCRHIYFIPAVAVLLIAGACERFSGEPLHIPDEAFLEGLIELGADRNHDGMISTREAEMIHKIALWPRGIRDLSGIEAFVNLDTLSIYLNPVDTVILSANRALRYVELIGCELASLDVGGNSMLTYLDCAGTALRPNALKRLDLSANSGLVYLDCAYNDLVHLDLASNTRLRSLSCGRNRLESLEVAPLLELETLLFNNNQITAIDLRKNVALQTLISCGNRLTSLDLSQNMGLKRIGIDNMPMLEEVGVWTLPFPPQGIEVLSGYSPNIVYVLSCNE